MSKREEVFRREKADRDQKTLDDKVERWKQIQPISFGSDQKPNLIWEYLNAMDEMFIDGCFIGTVLLCAAITEIVLSNQLVSHGIMKSADRTIRLILI